jgi:hypothetical protein
MKDKATGGAILSKILGIGEKHRSNSQLEPVPFSFIPMGDLTPSP